MHVTTSSVRVWVIAIAAALAVFFVYQFSVNRQLDHQNRTIASQQQQIISQEHQLAVSNHKICLNAKLSASGIVKVSNVAIHNIEVRGKTLKGAQKKANNAGLSLWHDLVTKFTPAFKAIC